MKCVSIPVLLAIILPTHGAALAGEAPALDIEPLSRVYEIVPIEGGVVRMNTESGEMTFCRPLTRNLVCRPALGDSGANDLGQNGPGKADRRPDEQDDARLRLAGVAEQAILALDEFSRRIRNIRARFQERIR